MATLVASCTSLATIKLNPLAQLSGLTLLDISGTLLRGSKSLRWKDAVEPSVELDCLPASIRSLTINAIYLDPDCISMIKFTALTSLGITWSQNELADLARLMDKLLLLKVTYFYLTEIQVCSFPSTPK